MKTRLSTKDEGGVLITVLAMLVVMTAVCGSVLSIVTHEYMLSKRTLAWNQSLYAAEVGIESAWNELNRLTGINSGTFMGGTNWTPLASGIWQYNGGQVSRLAGVEENATFNVTVNTNIWTIESTGTANSPLMSTPVSRKLQVVVHPTTPFEWAILAKGLIDFNGKQPKVDSWDSLVSGPYAEAKRKGNGNIGTNGLQIEGDGSVVWGSLQTGPGGETTAIDLSIQDVAVDKQNVFPNGKTNGLKVSIPDVAQPWLPAAMPNAIPATQGAGANEFLYKDLGGGTFKCGDGTTSLSANLVVNGPGTFIVWVKSLSGAGGQSAEVVCSNNATVVIYVEGGTGGDDVKMTGNSLTTGYANNLFVYGRPKCRQVKLGGNSQTFAAIYAPSAEVDLQGTADLFGAIIANNVKVSGNPNLHYDENLDLLGIVVGFSLVTYREM